VHTIAGVLTGKLFLSNRKNKINPLLFWGLICLISGYLLNATYITPIIKRIATSSFTLASLGWCLFGLAFCYWWIDMRNHKKYLNFFIVVGTNSLFIYLFFEIVGHRWFNDYINAIAGGAMELINITGFVNAIISSLCIFALEWSLCYFLYKNKIFFKL
jgi:predicted acyltransferase